MTVAYVLPVSTEVRAEADRAVLLDHSENRAVSASGIGRDLIPLLGVPRTLVDICRRLPIAPDGGADEIEGLLHDWVDQGLVERHEDAHVADGRRRYLDLVMFAVTNLIYPEHELRLEQLERGPFPGDEVEQQRRSRDIRYDDPSAYAGLVASKLDGQVRDRRVTRYSHTMIGMKRLQNLERCAASVFRDRVPGDFLEAGVCQGGASIFLRALQVAYEEPQRLTWVADSFRGLPPPTDEVDLRHGMDLTEARHPWLAASLTAVRDNFRTYDLLSEQVRFLEGWFADTLPSAPVERLALLRIDGDLHSSTSEVLEALYDRVSPGGYVVVDDYSAFEACRTAVDEFLVQQEPVTLTRIDWTGVCWRKPGLP